jgi:hypothetical protein
MTRVLLVYHDTNVADIEGDELRRAGFEVDRCAGPIGGDACPVLDGRPCWQVNEADVLVYDTYGEFGHGVLVEDLLELHPDKPLVLTTPLEADAPVAARHDASPAYLVAPSRAELVGTVERALRTPRPAPARRTKPAREMAFAGRRW